MTGEVWCLSSSGLQSLTTEKNAFKKIIMRTQPLILPVIQNWSCHNCGGCCREHLIEITAVEKRRIEKQKWKAADGIDMSKPVIQSLGAERYRLAHRSDGACVFLNDEGLCRIHDRFGEAAKPLACRVYPYAYHPSGGKLAVSLRFSCPSVVRNAGQAVTAQQQELIRLSESVVSGKKTKTAAPDIHTGSDHGIQQVPWSDFHQFLKAMDEEISDTSVHFAVRLMRILSWLDLVQQSQFATVRNDKLAEFLGLITSASRAAQPDNDLPEHRPSRLGRTLFRLMTAQLARHDTEAHRQAGLKYRVRLGMTAMKFAAGFGSIPALEGSSSVATAFGDPFEDSQNQTARFRDIERPYQGRTEEIDELFERYFRVKIQGIHFCGPGHYDSSLVHGFYNLALMYPATLWLARWRAAIKGADQLQLEDVQAALATADHNFGYSPALAMKSSQTRVSQLVKMQQLTALVEWYSR